jgi:hypothetical protein
MSGTSATYVVGVGLTRLTGWHYLLKPLASILGFLFF